MDELMPEKMKSPIFFALAFLQNFAVGIKTWSGLTPSEKRTILHKYAMKCEAGKLALYIFFATKLILDRLIELENEGVEMTADLYDHVMQECEESPVLKILT